MTELIYLFAYFTGNGEAGMRLAASEDGLMWTDVADHYFIQPESGLMRDPFLMLGPDGDFHLIWTTDWESQDIGYAHSNDLVNWNERRRLPVMQSVEGTRNCWAPEAIYDEQSQEYVIFWASTVPGRFSETRGSSEDSYNHRMWYVTTPDFENISAPRVFYDPGFNVIDVTLLPASDGGWRLVGKNETLTPERKDLFTATAPSPFGPWSNASKAFTESWVEGPATLKIGEWTYIYFDAYRSQRYGGVRTRDFKTFEDISDEVTFPQGARHGSIIAIPRTRLEEIKGKL